MHEFILLIASLSETVWFSTIHRKKQTFSVILERHIVESAKKCNVFSLNCRKVTMKM